MFFFTLISSSDLDQDEHLIVTAPVEDQDNSLSHNMGQDELAVPVGGPLEISMQTLEAEQSGNLPESLGSVPPPDLSLVKITPEVAECTGPSSKSSETPAPILFSDSFSDLVAFSAPTPAAVPEPVSVQSSEPEVLPASDYLEKKHVAQPELECNQTESTQKNKTSKSKPPSLKMKATLDEHAQTNEEKELPVPKVTYNFDPEQINDSFNPFTSGGSKIQNSPPPCGTSSLPRFDLLDSSLPACEASSAAQGEVETMALLSEAKPVMLEFGLDEGTVSKPPPRKFGGKKTVNRNTAKKQRAKDSEAFCKPAPEHTVSETDYQAVSETFSQQVPEPVPESVPEPVSDPVLESSLPISDSSAPLNLDDVPIPKTGKYNFDPSQWDDPSFNPFGSNSQVSSSPEIAKGSYSFDPDICDDSVDPFKPSKSLNTEDSSSNAAQPAKKVKDACKQKAGLPSGEKKVRTTPKKGKERTIT